MNKTIKYSEIVKEAKAMFKSGISEEWSYTDYLKDLITSLEDDGYKITGGKKEWR